MLRTIREHVAAGRAAQAASESVPGVIQTAFVPLPEKGPAKTFRKKAATFLQVLLINGPRGIGHILKQKKENAQ